LGVWDMCWMYRDLSEKGAIVDRLDLEFLLHLNARTVGNPATRTKILPLPLTRRSNILAIGSVPLLINFRSRMWLDLPWIAKMQYLQ
jgi:hypothetical protein